MTEPDCHDWKQLAEAAGKEKDSEQLMELIRQLTRALEEHMKNPGRQSSEARG